MAALGAAVASALPSLVKRRLGVGQPRAQTVTLVEDVFYGGARVIADPTYPLDRISFFDKRAIKQFYDARSQRASRNWRMESTTKGKLL